MTLRTIIVDDEPLAREFLRDALSEHPDVEIVDECGDGAAAILAITRLLPDLVFLDIRMPKLDGFELVARLVQRPTIVFLTAHEERALEAFSIHAIDYLLKPLDPKRLRDCLHHVRRLRRDEKKLIVRRLGETRLLPVKEILWIEAKDDYVIHHTAKDEILDARRIGELEDELSPSGSFASTARA